MIDKRPAEAAERSTPRHREGDLITGASNRSAIGTLVERTSRFTILLHLPADHGAQAVRDAVVAALAGLPASLRRSLTWDQGSEMALHALISQSLEMPVFLWEKASPWQRRPSNENTNGLLAPVLSQGHRPGRAQPQAAGRGGCRAQRPPAQDPGLGHSCAAAGEPAGHHNPTRSGAGARVRRPGWTSATSSASSPSPDPARVLIRSSYRSRNDGPSRCESVERRLGRHRWRHAWVCCQLRTPPATRSRPRSPRLLRQGRDPDGTVASGHARAQARRQERPATECGPARVRSLALELTAA
jgi:hypothetical protein